MLYCWIQHHMLLQQECAAAVGAPRKKEALPITSSSGEAAPNSWRSPVGVAGREQPAAQLKEAAQAPSESTSLEWWLQAALTTKLAATAHLQTGR